MGYRSAEAQKLHNSILEYIHRGMQLTALEEACANVDENALLEKSTNGHSHLIDVFHITSQTHKNSPVLIAETIDCLFQFLIKKSKELHSTKALRHLLLEPESEGFTPLHAVLISAQPQNIQAYFAAVQNARTTNIITATEYKQLLIGANKAGFTPLHEALISAQPQNIQAYFAAVQNARTTNIITATEYKQLLIGANAAGFTPLHQALISAQPQNMQAYFAEVQNARAASIITANEYKQLLVGANKTGFTPLHDVLKSGQPQSMQAYFVAVQQAYKDNIIPKDEYKQLLISANNAGFTPMHQAANCGTLAVVQSFVAILQECFTPNEMINILNATAKGHIPSCQASKPGYQEINRYLDDLRKQYAGGSKALLFSFSSSIEVLQDDEDKFGTFKRPYLPRMNTNNNRIF